MKSIRILLIPFLMLALCISALCQLANSPWPKFHRNALNTGVGAYGGSNGLKRWGFATGNIVASSPSVAADGTVYVGGNLSLYAVNPDGTKKWSFLTGGFVASSPAIGLDGTIYIGSQDGHLYAVNPDGSEKWSFVSGAIDESSPAIGLDGTIYVGSSDDNLFHAVNPDGSEKWKYDTGSAIETSPAIGPDGTIYAGAGSSLYALNTDGSKKWTYATGGNIFSSPAIGSDGTICVGSEDGKLYAINPDGSRKWAFPTSGPIESSPAIGKDGTIYIGSADDNLYAVNPDGSAKWSFLTTWSIYFCSPIVGSDGTIYVGNHDGNLYAIGANGTMQWTLGGLGDLLYSSPSIGSDGTIYVGSNDGNLYAVGTEVNTIAISNLSLNPGIVTGGASSIATVSLSSAAPAGGDIVTLKSGSCSATTPAFIVVPGGATQATFTIATTPVSTSTSAVITASSGGNSATATLTITPPVGLSSLGLTPTSLIGGTPSTGTVTLSGPAPSGGILVNLSSNSTVAVTPPNVTVAAGALTASFTISTGAVATSTTATITAAAGTTTVTAGLTVSPAVPSSLTMSPTSVTGGSPSTGTVTLNGPAPSSGAVVSLASSSGSAIPPASVTVSPGATSASFAVSTHPVVSSTAATITATLGGISVTASLTVNPPVPTSVTLTPSSVFGGTPSVGTVTLNGPAPSGGTTVNLSSSSSSAVPPTTVVVPAGATSASFTITTSAVTTLTTAVITATVGGNSVTANLAITPPGTLSGLTLNPTSVPGGFWSSGTVTLTGPAPLGGLSVSLSSSSPNAVPPPTVTVAWGTTSASFTVTTTTVLTSTPATITASAGNVSIDASLNISTSPAPQAPKWSLGSNSGNITVSPLGNQVAISSSNSVKMLSYPGYKLMWSRRVINGTFAAQTQFAPDGSSVWIWQGRGGGYVTQYDATTGNPVPNQSTGSLQSLALPGGTSYFEVCGHEIVAAISYNGGFTIASYDSNTLLPVLAANTLTFANGNYVNYGSWNGHDAIAQGTQIWDITTGALIATISSSISALIDGFDPGNGLIVQMWNGGSTSNGTYRFVPDSSGNPVIAWHNSGFYAPSSLGSASSSLMIGSAGYVTGVMAFNWQTGALAWGGATIPFDGNNDYASVSNSPTFTDGHMLFEVGPYGILQTFVEYAITNDGLTAVGTLPNIPPDSVYSLAATPNGVIIGGAIADLDHASSRTYTGLHNAVDGTAVWRNQTFPGEAISRVSPSGSYVATCYMNNQGQSEQLVVYDATNGSVLATLAGSYKDTAWIDDTRLLALDSSWNRLDVGFNGSSLVITNSTTQKFYYGCAIGFHVGQGSDGQPSTTHFAVGLGSSGLTAVALDGSLAGQTSSVPFYFPDAARNLYRIVPLSNGEVACLGPADAPTDAGFDSFRWTTYMIDGNGQISLDKTYSYTPPDQPSYDGSFSFGDFFANGDISFDGKVVAFTEGHDVDQYGNPVSSQLVVKRTSDGAVIQTLNGSFTGIRSFNIEHGSSFNLALLAFSPDHSILYVADAFGERIEALPVPSFVDSLATPSPVASGTATTLTINLGSAAPAGGETVYLNVTPAIPGLPTTMTIPAGGSSTVIQFNAPVVLSNTTYTIQAITSEVAVPVSTSLVVNAAVFSNFSFTPSSITAGGSSQGTVSFLGLVPANTPIALSSSNPLCQVPSSISSTSDSSSFAFTAVTSPSSTPFSSTITATFNGASVTANLTVGAGGLLSVSTSPASIVGGDYPTGTVILAAPAPLGGTVVALSASKSSVAPPSTVTIAAGATSATFSVPTLGVDSNTPVTITATLDSTSKNCTLTLLPAWVASVTVSPASVLGGSSTSVTGTVNLNGKAGPSGTVVTLSSSNTSAATVPASVTVAAGSSHGTFSVTHYSVSTAQTVTITATNQGKSSTATLTVNPASLVSVSTSPTSIVGGDYPTGTVTISGPAPTGGAVISLGSGSSSLNLPSTVTIPAGTTSTTFLVPTLGVNSSTATTITATLNSTSKTCTLTLLPASVTSVTVSPASVIGGSSTTVTGTVNLNGSAGPSGVVVNLSSSNTSAASVPATVTVAANTKHATFTVTTHNVASAQTVTISANSATTTLTVNPSGLAGVSTSPTSIVGGDYPTGTVTLNNPAPAGGTAVSLSSGNSLVSVPSTVTVSAGSTSATFTVQTLGVDSSTPVTITATLSGSSKTCTLTLLPASIYTVAVSPTSVVGGSSTVVTGTVTLNGDAGPSGTVVSLSTSNMAIATVPTSVTVIQNGKHATFTVTTYSVASAQSVTITAKTGSTSATTALTVNPGSLASITTSPTSIVGGDYPTGTVTLTVPAPPGGTVVSIGSNNALITPPASVTVPAGSKSTTFSVPTLGVDSSTPVTLTATLGSTSKTCTVTLLPAAIYTVTLNASSVTGGGSVTGTVNLNGDAGPSGVVVTLSSSDTSSAAVPASVTVTQNGKHATFTVTTHPVASAQTVTITATGGGKSATVTLTVNP